MLLLKETETSTEHKYVSEISNITIVNEISVNAIK